MTIKYTEPGSSNDILKVVCQGYWFSGNGWLNGPNDQNVVGHYPIPEAYTQPFITPRIAILHSNAGPNRTAWQNLIAYWRRADITGEAHFQISDDGFVAQAMGIDRRADCNYRANQFVVGGHTYGAISFETQDNGAATLARTPWSLPALNALVQITKALVIQCDIHCTQPAYWNSSGIGHHTLHPEWSSYTGKTCPGAARIAQMDYIRHEVTVGAAAFHEHNGTECNPQ